MLNKILAVALVGFAASASGMKAAGEADLLASPPTQEELATVPLDAKILGEPPPGGLRNWSLPTNTGLKGSYVSIVNRTDPVRVELWKNTWDGEKSATHQVVFRKGKSLEALEAEEFLAFDGSLIDDVFDVSDPTKLSPNRGATRVSVTFDPEVGYIVLCCVCPDYLPGTVTLIPAIFTSKSGEPGSFRYLGKLKGECADLAAQKKIWSDGGTLVRLPGGGWRIYLNGFGPKLAAMECATLTGPWKFLRDGTGSIRELLPSIPVGCVFPDVLRDAGGQWHLLFSDKWPPQSIWHMVSSDGVGWEEPGPQPEITREHFRGHGIKCMRGYLDLSSGKLCGLLSVYPFWTLHKFEYGGTR